jgi:hypothetical protein
MNCLAYNKIDVYEDLYKNTIDYKCFNSSRKFSVQQTAQSLIEVFCGEENNEIHN